MDRFAAFALVWLACAVLASLIGMLRGRGGDAMTLGVLLGPLGVVLTLMFIAYQRPQEAPHILKMSDAVATPRAVAKQPPVRQRRAA